jgi:hypothetical protein
MILEKGMVWFGLIWFSQGPVEIYCKNGNELSGHTKSGKFLSSRATGGFSRIAQLREVCQIVS